MYSLASPFAKPPNQRKIFLRHWASGLHDKLEKHIHSTTRPLLWTFGMTAVKILNEMMMESAY